tara:strand:+ start:993 stop:2105 length:1113 start_codon:yes stop_codon:yes gene_type:complete
MGKFLDSIIGRYTDDDGLDFSNILQDAGIAATAYGVLNPNNSEGLGNFFGTGGQQQPVGYMGGIPNYTATQGLAPNAFTQNTTNPTGEIVPRRPGSMGRRYFNDLTYTQSGAEPTMGMTQEDLAAQAAQVTANEELLDSLIMGAANTRIASTGNRQDNEEGYINFDDFDITGGTPAAPPAAPPAAAPTLTPLAPPMGPFPTTVETTVSNPSTPLNIPEGITLTSSPFSNIEADGDYTPAEAQAAAQLINQNPNFLGEAARYFGMTEKQVKDIVNSLYPNTFAQGGDVNGYYLGGTTDGMADQIPATIDNAQPAALSDGEFVIPADVVSHLGNGNSDAGAQNLYSMMDRIREDRTGNPKQGRQIDPNKYLA